jgi:hypothetical protein
MGIALDLVFKIAAVGIIISGFLLLAIHPKSDGVEGK